MKVIAILQARISSRRLPNKVLAPLCGRPMLLMQIERVRRSHRIEQLIVATSTDPSDDALQAVCEAAGLAVARGSLKDVLDRFWQAARDTGAEHVVRLTGDCPLIDPQVIDQVIEAHLAAGADYTSNSLPTPTWPDGLDVEVARMTALQQAWQEATLPSDREHVLPFVWRQPERFRLHTVAHVRDLSGLRWTVDEPADLAFVRAVFEALYEGKPDFGMQDVLTLLERRPDLAGINLGIQRNAGYAASLTADSAVGANKRND